MYLATDSIPHQGNEQVTLIGRGATDPEGDVKYDKIWDRRIRQAEFTTIPIDKCMTDAQFHPGHPNMAVCAPRHNGVVLGSGDSGKESYFIQSVFMIAFFYKILPFSSQM